MNKKFLFVGMAAILGASLVFLGCESPTDGAAGAPGQVGTLGDTVISQGISVEALQRMIDHYNGSGAELVLDDVMLTNTGVIDFKSVKVVIFGKFTTFGGGVTAIKALSANVEFASGAEIVTQTGDVIISGSEVFKTDGPTPTVTGGGLIAAPAPGDNLPTTAGEVGGITAMETLTLDASTTIPAGLTVYVYGTLTVDGDAEAPVGGASVVAVGNVTLKPTTAPNTSVLADDDTVDVSGAIITLESDDANYTLPATFHGREIRLPNAPSKLTLTGVTDIDVYLPDRGTLILPAAVTAADIGGNGTVVFGGKVESAGFIVEAGTVEFNHGDPVEFAVDDSVTAAGTITFKGGFKTPGDEGTVTLDGDVFIPATKTIAFGDAGGTLTLAEGAGVYLDGDYGLGENPTLVFEAATELVVTGADDTAELTAKAGGDLDVSEAGVTFDGDVVFGGDLTLGVDGTAAPVTFNGAAFFQPGAKITMADTGSTITLGEETGALAYGIPGDDLPTPFLEILSSGAGSAVLLTPGTNDTTLTFDAEVKGIIQGGGTSGHKITVSDGDVYLVSGSAYTVESGTGNVGTLEVGTGIKFIVDNLVLAAGEPDGDATIDPDEAPQLILTAAASAGAAILTGDGEVVAGNTTITAGGANTWMAISTLGGAIAISDGAITGTAGDELLTASADDAIIAVAATADDTENVTLTVTSAGIDINTAGKVTLTGDDTAGARAILVLTGGEKPGSLVINSTDGDQVDTVSTTKLAIGGSGGTDNPAEIQVAGDSITTDADNVGDVTVIAADANATSAVAVHKLGGGDTEDTTDLWIVSSADAATKTTIVKGDEILAD
jgi:hypothetical protein